MSSLHRSTSGHRREIMTDSTTVWEPIKWRHHPDGCHLIIDSKTDWMLFNVGCDFKAWLESTGRVPASKLVGQSSFAIILINAETLHQSNRLVGQRCVSQLLKVILTALCLAHLFDLRDCIGQIYCASTLAGLTWWHVSIEKVNVYITLVWLLLLRYFLLN